jgi:hypothetical protein
MALLVYYDQRLNGRSGIGWAFFVFFTGPIGLIIYFLLYRDTLELAGRRMKRNMLKDALESPLPAQKRVDHSSLSAPPSTLSGERGFEDPELEELIKGGNVKEARAYLDRLLDLGRDMGDEDFVAKYEKYQERIAEIETEPRQDRLEPIEPYFHP